MQIKVEHYGVEGTGRTVKEAKLDAGQKIRDMLAGTYAPHVITYRGWAVLVYRDPSGWATRLIADDEGIRSGTDGGSCHGYNDQFDAMKAARAHVAQLGWTAADGLTAPAFLASKQEQGDFVSWAKFQIACLRLRAEGVPEMDIHRQACDAMYAPAESVAA